MPRFLKAMKDVINCDKFWFIVNNFNQKFPNGETY